MEKDSKIDPDFDDIVFYRRNKEYGAYKLRKNYSRNVLISIMISILIMTAPIITPYLNARALQNRQKHVERQVVLTMENLDQPAEQVVPPPPPPPPSTNVVQQQKYVPPQVVDSIKPEDINKQMTADQANSQVSDKEAVEVASNSKEELTPEMANSEPFLTVQEMPEPPGGMPALYKYIAENTHYPAIAEENNIQGKVFVRFCVTSKGTIDQISIFKGVDPALNAEAIRVVKTFPQFKPGKQEGIPVPVWFTVYINFTLK
jgi:protein TonB